MPEDERKKWLDGICDVLISPDYTIAFELWKSSFRNPNERALELELASRLLVGHGNGSATDVGLTVHHTWGVPIIPGTAIKGLVSHYVSAVYGPENAALPAWEQEGAERDRARWQGNTWVGARRGPGDAYRTLFGAADAREDAEMRRRGFEAGATAGSVAFHDALFVPREREGRVFSPDVLTVHQKGYYDSKGELWPNDYDDPNPVAFLSVVPHLRLLFAFSAPVEVLDLVERVLLEALGTWGIGGKTSSGYGRLIRSPINGTAANATPSSSLSRATVLKARYQRGQQVLVKRLDDNAKGRARFEADDGILGYFQGSSPPIAIGESVQAWIWNVGQSYTLDIRPPNRGKK
jgi:CRISPR-associated protein Cmr6